MDIGGYWCDVYLRQVVVTVNVLNVRSYVKDCGSCCVINVVTGFFVWFDSYVRMI